MKLFFSYLASRSMALLPPAFVLIFAAVLLLYGLPLYAVSYAALLCMTPYALLLAVDFLRFRSRHLLLERLRENALTCAEHLPAPGDALEADYAALLRAIARERDETAQRVEARYGERIGYYTLWAHQIKTPIAAMRLLLAGQDSADARALSCELSRIEQYVEMALCYLRLDGESTDYAFASCALEPLVRACVKKYAPQFIRGRLCLALEALPGSVLTDEKWLAFVIDQLLSNAVKYTPAGGTIRIGLSAPGVLFIEDTGIGIAAEDLPRIFEQGFTGMNGRTDKRATGLGLYLCRRICQNLGHTLRCESEPGRGTRMTLDLNSRALQRE